MACKIISCWVRLREFGTVSNKFNGNFSLQILYFETSPDGKISEKDLKVSDFHFTPGTILVELSFLWQGFMLAVGS